MCISSRCRAALRGLAFLPLFVLLSATAAHAGEFSVSPVRVDLTATESVSALRIRNDGANAVVIQSRLFRWTQEHGEDKLQATNEALVTPPVVSIPAGGTQVVRVGLRRTPEAQQEITYRLFVEEVPSAPEELSSGLRVITRLSIPVFVAPTEKSASPALRWVMQLGQRQELLLAAYNEGNGHARISDPTLSFTDGARVTLRGVHYLLPGNERVWVIEPQGGNVHRGSTVTVQATINGDTTDARISLQ